MYHQLKLLSMKENLHQNHNTLVHSLWMVQGLSNDCHYDKNEFFNLDLQNNCSQYKIGKYVACFCDGNWYFGIIFECYYENQDCSIKFMTRNNLNLNWISDSGFSFCQVAFKNLICIIDSPQAVGSSGRQYISSKCDFVKITTLVNQP